MRKYLFAISFVTMVFLTGLSQLTIAQYPYPDKNENQPGNCTSIMVGRLATTDGSVITSHTCDGPYRTWVEIFPHSKYEKGSMHPVYSGVLYPHEASFDTRDIIKTGEIPEVDETYSLSIQLTPV